MLDGVEDGLLQRITNKEVSFQKLSVNQKEMLAQMAKSSFIE